MAKKYTLREYVNLLETANVPQATELYFALTDDKEVSCCGLGLLGYEDYKDKYDELDDDPELITENFVPGNYLDSSEFSCSQQFGYFINQVIDWNDAGFSFKQLAEKIREKYLGE